MTDDFELSAPELTPADILTPEDDRFTEETVALVTGAASGIGQATSVALAMNGLTVVGADVDSEGLDETATMAPAGSRVSRPTSPATTTSRRSSRLPPTRASFGTSPTSRASSISTASPTTRWSSTTSCST